MAARKQLKQPGDSVLPSAAFHTSTCKAYLQILPEGENVHPGLPQVLHRLQYLVVLLPQPEHDAAFGDHAVTGGLGHPEHLHGLVVPGRRKSGVDSSGADVDPQLRVRFLKRSDNFVVLLLSVTIPSQAGLANSEHLFVKQRYSLNVVVKFVTKVVKIQTNRRFHGLGRTCAMIDGVLIGILVVCQPKARVLKACDNLPVMLLSVTVWLRADSARRRLFHGLVNQDELSGKSEVTQINKRKFHKQGCTLFSSPQVLPMDNMSTFSSKTLCP
jgi:hypothetical protein